MAHTASDTTPIEFQFSEQLRASFDPALGAMWLRWNPKPRPSFNPTLLAACNEYCEFLQRNHGVIQHAGRTYSVGASVLGSDVPGIFNLGGDLDLFATFIESRDRTGLLNYGMACVEVVYRNYVCYDLPLTTISLVQGECLGGGFEAALSSQVIIAERRARFGFPEIMFNLFPGMGAVSFVLRRADKRINEELTSTAKIYSADELLQRGVIDKVVDDGQGPAAVQKISTRPGSRHASPFPCPAACLPLNRDELDDIVSIWVDAALKLNPRDLKLMKHLVARQNRLG